MKRRGIMRWGYAVCGVVVLLFAGLVYAWSVLSAPIASEFPQWSKAQLSFTFTLTMIMFCAGCLAGGFLGEKLHIRWSLIFCGILFCIGFFLVSASQSLALLYVGFGVFGGIASGLSYNVVISTVMGWFPDKSGIISGLLLMGFGIGSFLIGKCYQAFTSVGAGGWRVSFRVFAVLLLVVMALSAMLIKKPGMEADLPAAGKKPEERTKKEVNVAPSMMIKMSSFWFYYLWAIAMSMAGLTLLSQAGGIAAEAVPQIDAGVLATVVGLISIFNGIGRVCFGALFDRKGYHVTLLAAMLVFVFAGLMSLAALKTQQLSLVIVGFVAGGFAYGAVNPMNSAIIRSFFGPENYAANFSVINTNLIFSSFASTIAGLLYDASGSYQSSIFMMLAAALLGVVFYFQLIRVEKKK